MKTFKLEIDTNTIYIKAIRFLGTLLIGLSLGWISFEIKYDMEIKWLNAVSLISSGFILAFFPGRGTKAHLLINEEGLFSFPIRQDFSFRDSSISWDKVELIALEKNHIAVKEIKGPWRKLKLPFYTKEQWGELKTYLKDAADFKQVEFK